jgi:hypothetical protein
MAGYSGTPLPQKLGITPDTRPVVIGPAPPDLDLGGAVPAARLGSRADVVLLFTTARRDLERRIPRLAHVIHPTGALWVCWPKRASKVETDMTEDVVREVVLPRGLVDTKVCAIDETWSGLRIVWRRDRR